MKRKTKKVNKYRGSHTHGSGAKKKRRGAGNRGGRGFAGSGKRADQKKPRYWKEKYFSGPTFKPLKQKPESITIEDIEQKFEKYTNQGLITENNGLFEVSISKSWKLLSQGKPTRKYFIQTSLISKKAKEKIIDAGGKVKEKAQQLNNKKE